MADPHRAPEFHPGSKPGMFPSQIDQFSQAIAALDEQGKASFCVWLAVRMQESLAAEDAERVGICHAVELLQSWEAGESVTGNELNELLMNANDEGLHAFVDSRRPRKTDSAIEVVGGAICYIAWLAYRRAGESLPDGIDQVNDDFIIWVIQQALDAQTVTREYCLSAMQGLAKVSE
ncbi:hypothetical protein CKY39_07960 [Variovorax boronicumulans]|uniref:DUF416 domain-containing protein n=1 Tax=Variovorax boronicumulans TaxID=436515 RepID=A0A250DFX7_9BURK|nr:Imm6 family immunity protein [Variovorax boronicumulans]ATA53152.1 hypothetical protein CKY39_07960 [Variovorax boronicumulans]